MIDANDIEQTLTTKFIGRRVKVFESVDSTNSAAKRLADAGAPEGTVVIAHRQTAGKGRLNRQWHGEPGKGLLLSVILQPRDRELAQIVTFITAISVAKAVETNTGLEVECKWPNDLLLNGKKFCGILLESDWRKSNLNFLIAGIGLNVNEQTFPAELEGKATSLRLECGREIERPQLLRDILEGFEREYSNARSQGGTRTFDEWAKRCRMLGKSVSINQSGKILTGKAVRLGSDGALILESQNGETRVFAGDATVVG
jgi:BirA family biotin operon repressor/biotin-[acetyl-CoA-carboxylase] ligase